VRLELDCFSSSQNDILSKDENLWLTYTFLTCNPLEEKGIPLLLGLLLK